MNEDTIALMASCKHHSACQRLVTFYAPFDMNAAVWAMCRACPYNEPQDGESEEAEKVLRDIDQLRRDLAKYHDVIKAYDNLQQHCNNQRKELASLSAAHEPVKNERDLYRKQCDRLAAENAKLRELVHDFDKWLSEAEYVAYVQGHGTIHDYTLLVSFRSRMRELGIEAD